MCIKKDGSMCPLLSKEETLAQHNFEERKGPYPLALEERLHTQGIMSRDEYRKESYARRVEHVEAQVKLAGLIFDYLGEHSDCTPEEKAYMGGSRHEFPPADPYIPPELWSKFSLLFRPARKRKFDRLAQALTRSNELSYLMQYPEFGEWFKVKAKSALGRLNFIKHTTNFLFTNLGLFESFVSKVDGEMLHLVVRCLVIRFINEGFLTENQQLKEIIGASLPESKQARFKKIIALNLERCSIPDKTRDQRSKRRKLSKLLRASVCNLTRDLGYDQAILTQSASKMTEQWLEMYYQNKSPLLVAA